MSKLQEEHAFFFSLKDFSVGKILSAIEHRFNGDTIKDKLEKKLEDLRRCKYKEYPSRLKCTFVAPTEESANDWCKTVKSQLWAQQGCYLEYYIYEVVGAGPFYWFNADLLMEINWPYNKDINVVTDEYWLSCSKTKPYSTTFDIEGLTDNSLRIVSKKKMYLDKNRIYKVI